MSKIYRSIRIADKKGMISAIVRTSPSTEPEWASDVPQNDFRWQTVTSPQFDGPIRFVRRPSKKEPFYVHNHQPAITWCKNGDLLAIWFSTPNEASTDMTVLASRLRAGGYQWDPSSEFFNAVKRNMTGSALFHDENGKIYHFNSIGQNNVKGWDKLALLMRTSNDNGVTWSKTVPISDGHIYKNRHQVIAGTFMTEDGVIVQPCDGTSGPYGSTAIHISRDGDTWMDTGGNIRGIHAGVVELKNRSLMAFGRAMAIKGRIPVSISNDMGVSWRYQPGVFSPIGGGQRLVLKKLREGPILLVSFTSRMTNGIRFIDANGKMFKGKGMYASISFDDGRTWPVRKLITPGIGKYISTHARSFITDYTRAEPSGYLAATQTPDRMIHLLSSMNYYRFNLEWLKQPNIGPYDA